MVYRLYHIPHLLLHIRPHIHDRKMIDKWIISRYEVQVVGVKQHQELWIPAEELAEFNGHLIGVIEIIVAYYGEEFQTEENRGLLESLKIQ